MEYVARRLCRRTNRCGIRQFIDPAQAVLPQLLILGVTYLVVDGAILIGWGWVASRSMRKFNAAFRFFQSCDGVWWVSSAR